MTSAEVLDEGPDDVEMIGIAWLLPMDPPGGVRNARTLNDPLPQIIVRHIPGDESVEESTVDDLLSVHMLHEKGDLGSKTLEAANWMATVHRRMLLLCRHLPDVPLPGGRIANIDFCSVFSRPEWQEYDDDQILRKVARYRIGLSYAKL